MQRQAKEIALKEMKEKVMKEFKAREAGTGVGKMKWDTQVRMRQAKARVTGEANYSRCDDGHTCWLLPIIGFICVQI
jgi:hypothetical protein